MIGLRIGRKEIGKDLFSIEKMVVAYFMTVA